MIDEDMHVLNIFYKYHLQHNLNNENKIGSTQT